MTRHITSKKLSVIFSMMLAVYLFLITGCASDVATYKDNPTLQPGFGWLALQVYSPNPEVNFEFNSGMSVYNSPTFPFGNNISLMQLPLGEYTISAFFAKAARFSFTQPEDYDRFGFRIEEGKINYMGDLRFNGNLLSLSANGDAFVKNMNRLYPDLVENHELKYTHISAYK